MAVVDDLRAAGFSDEEVTAFHAQKRAALLSGGFSDKEADDYLGAPPARAQPDTGAANKSFARVLFDRFSKSIEAGADGPLGGRTLAKGMSAVGTAAVQGGAAIAPVQTAQIEAALNAGSGLLFGFPTRVASSLGALTARYGLGMDVDPAAVADGMTQAVTYTPQTKLGTQVAGQINKPFELLGEGAQWAGERTTDLALKAGAGNTTAAAAGAITEQTLALLPMLLLGELGRKMGGQRVSNEDIANVAKTIDPAASPAAVAATEASLRAVHDQTGIGPFTMAEEAAKNPQLRAELADPAVEIPKAVEPFLPSGDEPAVADGHVRFYRGQKGEFPPATDATSDGRYFTTDRDSAAVYGGGEVRYVDVPAEEATRLQSELAEDAQRESFYVPKNSAVLPAEYANRAQPFTPHELDGARPGDGAPLLNVAEGKPNRGTQLNSGIDPTAILAGVRDSYTPYVGVEQEPRAAPKTAEGKTAGNFDGLLKIVAPAARGEIAEHQAGIMRANFGEMARQREMALERLKPELARFDKMSPAENIKFIDAMERGTPMEGQLGKDAGALRELLDRKRDEVQALGKGQLENFDENYFPHMWKDVDEATALFSRRPLAGPGSFLKQRTIPYTTDGLRWRAYDAEGDFVRSFDTKEQAQAATPEGGHIGRPLQPITTNPGEMALLKAREMDKYVYGQRIFGEMKDADLARFVGFGERAPIGWTKIDDKIARVWDSPDQVIREAFDKRLMEKLNEFADAIGVDPERRVNIGGATRWGYASRTGETVTKFGGPETVLTHELGHQLDFKYGLKDEFVNDPATKKELRALADLRYEGTPADQVPESFKKYVRKGEEKMANMVHAYVHMPDRFQAVAPNTFAKFTEFIDSHPELSVIKDIKPSLVLGADTATSSGGPGMILRGEFYAPDEAATLVNNHLSPGLQGNSFYDAWRGIGNAMNGMQLGLSFFHVGFTSMDAMVSKVALGMKQISRGDVLEGAGNVAQGMNPAQPVVNLIKGDKLLNAYLGKLDDPSLAPIVDAIQQAGGRVKMDDFYRNEQVNAFKQALRRAQSSADVNDLKGVLSATYDATKAFLPTVLDRASAPIFEYLVPRQKLGVFFDMSKDWLEKNPKATLEEKRAGLGKLWDSVDNRMGQLVYDNVFWNRALKDGLMATVRSVGWNLGTFRELGGGVLDIKDIAKDKAFSDRTAYLVALPFLASIYGSILNYAMTGETPQSLKDAFYPRTGNKRPDGSDDRVSLPTYMKDIFAYGEDVHNFAAYGSDPTQTLKNKAHPLIATVAEMLNNKDFFGGAIRNPADKAVKQLQDEALYLLHQVEPFSFRNYMQQAKVKGEEPSFLGYMTSPSMIGVVPAPGYITKSPEELESQHVSAMRDALVQKYREQIKAGANADELIPDMLRGGLSKKDIRYVIQSSGEVPKPHRLKKFGEPE